MSDAKLWKEYVSLEQENIRLKDRLAETERWLRKVVDDHRMAPQARLYLARLTDSAPAVSPYLIGSGPDNSATGARIRAESSAGPSRSKRMTDAGYPKRDDRLECDGCGKLFTAQFLPIHKCEADGPSETVAGGRSDG